MKLEKIIIDNFRCYKHKDIQFHPEMNLIVGKNGTGKTAILDAIAVSISTWILGFSVKKDRKNLAPTDASMHYLEKEKEPQFVESWPVTISAKGIVNGKSIQWERSKGSSTGNTRYGNADELIAQAKICDTSLAKNISLPLISYYGTMRLWQDPKIAKLKIPLTQSRDKPSRLDGYKYCVDPRISQKEFVSWFAKQEWQAFQNGQESTMLKVVRKAVVDCIEDAEYIRFDPKRQELLLKSKKAGFQPFSVLSDGQKCILSLVADIAQKAAHLNPHFGESVLEHTEGIVLIDELDLHLHPKWQRHIIEDLRNTFPKIQFICSTHSPFLIQSIRSSDELIMLDGLSPAELANKTLEDIAAGIMNINEPEVSARYTEMKGVATTYLNALNEADKLPKDKLKDFKKRLSGSLAPYADNPAFQAFLEMQRIAKLGE